MEVGTIDGTGEKLPCNTWLFIPSSSPCLEQNMRRRRIYSFISALATAAAAVSGGAANNIPAVVDAVPIDELHDESQAHYNAKNRMRRRQGGWNGHISMKRRKLGLLSDLHISTEPDESGVQLIAGRSQRHRIRRHKGDDRDGLSTKLLLAEPVNTATQTDVSQVAQGRTSASNVIYSSELFPRDGHQQLILVGDVITAQTTQADIPTVYIVGANNQVFDTSSGQPVAVQNVFWDPTTSGFVDSNGNNIPVDISVEYESDSASYFSGDSTQGRYEIRNGQLYYIRADDTAINTGFTIETGTNELIFIDGDGSVDRTGVAYRASDEQFILISSGEIVQFEITTETITTVENKVTTDQVVVETGAGNIIIEENSDAIGGVVGGNNNGGDGNDDSGDEDCKSTVKYRGKGGRRGGKGKGRYRRQSKKKKSKSKKKKSKSSKSSKGSRRLVQMELDDESDGFGRHLKSSKGSSHSKSSKSYSGKGKGRSYSKKKKNNRCD